MNRNDIGFGKRSWMAVVLCSAVLSACSKSGLEQPVVEDIPERGGEAALAPVSEQAVSASEVPDVPEIKEKPARPLKLTLEHDPSEAAGSDQTLGDAQKFRKKVLPEFFDEKKGDRALSVSGALLHRPDYEMTAEEEGFVDSVQGAEVTLTVKTR